ncbi:MAG: hypothetical protein KAH38_02715, partial [Candidatus Hydrogenedentes bacterium]|nr:hypothetical protein [Candidatus Hydrogenedentota bacterium]
METALEQGVSTRVLAIASIRYENNSRISRYSIVLSHPLTPERLMSALSENGAKEGISLRVDILSKNKILILIPVADRPCVELLCILTEPLSPSFYDLIMPVKEDDFAETEEIPVVEAETIVEQTVPEVEQVTHPTFLNSETSTTNDAVIAEAIKVFQQDIENSNRTENDTAVDKTEEPRATTIEITEA